MLTFWCVCVTSMLSRRQKIIIIIIINKVNETVELATDTDISSVPKKKKEKKIHFNLKYNALKYNALNNSR